MFYIRKATVEDAEAIAKVHVKSWQTTYQGIVEPSYLKSLKWEDKVLNWQTTLKKEDDAVTFVALDENEVIGFISGGKNRESDNYDAELYSIYIIQEFQDQGLGKKLFSKFTEWLIEHQFRSLIVWVAEKNFCQTFYSQLGGKLLPVSGVHSIGGTKLKVIAYAWEHLSTHRA